MTELCPPTTVKKGGLFKYVRMEDDTVRFVSFDAPWIPAHRDMVDEGEAPFSAGTVNIRKREVTMQSPDSWSLGIKSAPDDLEAIARFLWPPKAKKPVKKKRPVKATKKTKRKSTKSPRSRGA